MKRVAILLAILCLAAAADALSAASLRGDGTTTVQGEDALVVLWPGGQEIRLEVASANLQLVHDFARNVAPRAPGVPPMQGFDVYDRNTTQSNLGRAVLRIRATQPDAVVLVLHANATMAGDHPWTLLRNQDHVVEESHVYDAASRNAYYYEFHASAGLNWTADSTTLQAGGALAVYVWGCSIDVDGAQRIQTGFTEDQATPIERMQHWTFARLTVDGHASTTGPMAAAVFADHFRVTRASSVWITDARGELQAEDGPRLLDGPAQLGGGSYDVAPTPAGLEMAVANQPATAAGALRGAPAQVSPLVWTVPLVLVLGVPAAFRLRLFGGPSLWLLRGLRWDDRGHRRRARLAAHLALALDGQLAEAWMLAATAQLEGPRPKPARAEARFARAFRLLIGPDQAVAAYGAARAAALQGLAGHAGFWLRAAIHIEPDLLADAASEPDFRRVAGQRDFQNQVRLGNRLDAE